MWLSAARSSLDNSVIPEDPKMEQSQKGRAEEDEKTWTRVKESSMAPHPCRKVLTRLEKVVS